MQRFQRYDDHGWFTAGQVQVTTSVFLAAASLVFMVLGVIQKALFFDALLYSAEQVRAGQVWRLVTWPLANQVSLWLLISAAMMYLIGGDIEREMGRRKFAWLVGALVVIPALSTVAFDAVGTFGISPLVSPLFVVLVLWHPTLRTFFNLPLWALVVVFEVFELLQILDQRYLGAPIGGRLMFWAASLAVAALAARAFDLTEFTQIPKLPLPAFVTGDPYQKSNRERERRQRQEQRNTPRPSARPKMGRKGAEGNVVPLRNTDRPEARLDRADQADMDALLDKISETGMDSLNEHERRRLDELSRRLRGEA